MRPGGCLLFSRGGDRGRAGAFKNHGKVCVSQGAPRARAGAGGRKPLSFDGFAIPLENMKANDAFGGLRALVSPSFSRTQILHTLKYSVLKIVDRHAFLVGLPLHGCAHTRLRSTAHPLERLREFFK